MAGEPTRPWVTITVAVITGVLGLVGGGSGMAWLGDRFWPQNHPPKAQLKLDMTEGKAPLELVLNGGGSHDPDGEKLAVEWSVNGKILETTDLAFTHTFAQAGTYSIVLTVKDPQGLEAKDAGSIKVLPALTLSDFLERIDDIKDLRERGALVSAINLADLTLPLCDSLGAERCAQLEALKADILIEADRLGEARTAYARAVELNPRRSAYALSYAKLLIRQREAMEAAEMLSDLADTFHDFYELHYYLGIAYVMALEFAPARERLLYVGQNAKKTKHHAAFGVAVINLVSESDRAFDASLEAHLRQVVCDDPAVRDIRRASAETALDLTSLREVAFSVLGSERGDQFLVILENAKC